MSIAFGHWEERALCGIDDGQPKEKRRSRLREQRNALAESLQELIDLDPSVWDMPEEWAKAKDKARSLIAKIESEKTPFLDAMSVEIEHKAERLARMAIAEGMTEEQFKSLLGDKP